MGESPTRPGIFQASPLVVVTPQISPLALMPLQLMVPWTTRELRRPVLDQRVENAAVRGPALVGIEIVLRVGPPLPLQPGLPRVLGVEVGLDLEAEVAGERLGARADQQVVVGLVHHRPAPPCDGVRTPSRPATPPARFFGPCMQQESSCTTPSALGSPP